MDKSNDLQTIVTRLDDSTLTTLEKCVQEVREQKRVKVDINSIRAGMSSEDLARTRAEIARVLTEK